MAKEGYDFEVVEDTLPDFYCSICLKLMRDAIQLDCGHGMCNVCLQNLEKSSDKSTFLCPTCRVAIDLDKIHPATMINRIILSVKVKCHKEGCDWVGEVSNVSIHELDKCEFQMVSCSLNGCNVTVLKKELCEHEKTCDYRMIACDYCMEKYQYKLIPIHLRECDLFLVGCPNDCGEFSSRLMMPVHLTDCRLSLVECMFYSAGCTIKMLKKDLDTHLEDETQKHLLFVMKKLRNTETELRNTQTELCNTKTAFEAQKVENVAIQNDIQQLKFNQACSVKSSNNIGIVDDKVYGNMFDQFNESLDEEHLNSVDKIRNIVMRGLKHANNEGVKIPMNELQNIVDQFASSRIVQHFVDLFESSKNKMQLPDLFWKLWDEEIKEKVVVNASMYHMLKLNTLQDETKLLIGTNTKYHPPTLELYQKAKCNQNSLKTNSARYFVLDLLNLTDAVKRVEYPSSYHIYASYHKDCLVLKTEGNQSEGCMYAVNFVDGKSYAADVVGSNHWNFRLVLKKYLQQGFLVNGCLFLKMK